jgi:hypothetical protein
MFQDISKVANSSVSNHFIPTRGVKIKVTWYPHTWSIHLHYTQTSFYGTCTHWKISKGPEIITRNLWRLKLINMLWSHGSSCTHQSNYNHGYFICFPTC